MTISIIGGSGFLGTSLSRILQKDKIDHKVYDINLRSESHIYADVTDLNSLNVLHDSDILINLAAVHRDDVRPISKYDEVNVGGAEKICDAARKFNINKIIFTSSVAIYGFAPKNTKEDGEPNYFNDYGRTKYLAEQVYTRWFNEDSENTTGGDLYINLGNVSEDVLNDSQLEFENGMPSANNPDQDTDTS